VSKSTSDCPGLVLCLVSRLLVFFIPIYLQITQSKVYVSSVCFVTTVRLMSQCKQIFGDIYVTSCSINSPRSFEGFRQTLGRKFIQIRQRANNLPIDPYCKNRPLSATSKPCRKGVIFTMGVYGEFFIYCLLSSSKTFKCCYTTVHFI